MIAERDSFGVGVVNDLIYVVNFEEENQCKKYEFSGLPLL